MSVTPQLVEREQALATLGTDLALAPMEGDGRIELVAAVLRRLAGFLCPCPRGALHQQVVRSLGPLVSWTDDLGPLAEQAIEGALTGGDLLELANVVVAEVHDHPAWLYCAPPGFVRATQERIYILGITPDGALFLPDGLRARMRHQGCSRFLEPQSDEALPETLLALGLREIRTEAWLHGQKQESAPNHLSDLRRRLERDGATADIENLAVLRPASAPATPYPGRWTAPGTLTGLCVGRYPGPYGNRIWCLVDLEAGEVRRHLRLPLKESRLAASDAAWRAQLALDAVAGHPATFRRAARDGGFVFTGSSPLPRFARQRFEFTGRPGRSDDLAPYACWVPDALRESAEKFLQEQLWLQPQDQ